MNPFELFGILLIIGALSSIFCFVLCLLLDEIEAGVGLAMVTGGLTAIGFVVYVVLWVIAKIFGVL